MTDHGGEPRAGGAVPDEGRRQVEVSRTASSRFRARNVRGGEIEVGTGEDSDFTPVELLLVALAACSAIDVDLITSRRADPEQFDVLATGTKIRDGQGNRLDELALDFSVHFANDEAGRRAEGVLERSLRQSHDRLCTVTRTVEAGSPVAFRLRGDQIVPPSTDPSTDG